MFYATITGCNSSPRVTRDAINSRKLFALDWSHNDLPFLCNRMFLELKAVEIVNLNLASNAIRCIAQHAFLGLEELERLDLSRNNLTYIHQDTFKYNRKLHWLSLAENKLFTLPSESVFIYVLSLRFLDLSCCSVIDISYRMFKDIENIKYLNISHNQIRNIKQGTFDLLKELRCLDISFNSLSSLHSDSYFSNVNICDYLPSDSSESCLTNEVSSSVLKLKADNNPWNCDCEMKVLYDYNSKSVLKLPNLTCKEPSEYENQHWDVLKDADCRTSVSPTVTQTTEVPVPVSVTSSSTDQKSAISTDTEKPADNNIGSVLDITSVAFIAIASLMTVMTAILIALFIWLYSKTRKLEREYYARLRSDEEHPTNRNEIPVEDSAL
jgi:cbb3-type cytochrome oxidase subunit 3